VIRPGSKLPGKGIAVRPANRISEVVRVVPIRL
jgi:hypothetical protein